VNYIYITLAIAALAGITVWCLRKYSGIRIEVGESEVNKEMSSDCVDMYSNVTGLTQNKQENDK